MTLLALAALAQGAVEFDLDNKQNVIASRLEGTWSTRGDLSRQLWGRDPRALTVAFVSEKGQVEFIGEPRG